MITDSYKEPAMGCTDRVRFLAGARDFSLLHSVQDSTEAHPASYPVDNGVLFPEDKVASHFSWRVKWLQREADHSFPSSAEVKNCGAIPPLLTYISMECWSGN
jgi:hypothetical protein